MSILDTFRFGEFPEFLDGELIFPLSLTCRVCHVHLEMEDRVFRSCPAHRFRRGGVLASFPPPTRPDGNTRP